jgi:hypothetical protein
MLLLFVELGKHSLDYKPKLDKHHSNHHHREEQKSHSLCKCNRKKLKEEILEEDERYSVDFQHTAIGQHIQMPMGMPKVFVVL